MAQHTYSTAIIGNGSYIAHIDQKNTNISWLCWPRFDSSFVLGELIAGKEKGGQFTILPHGDFHTKQFYIENTNVVCTDMYTQEGDYRITDFAPRFRQYDRFFCPLMLIRKVEPLNGNPRVNIQCDLRDAYGDIHLEALPASNHIDYAGGSAPVRITTNFPISHILENTFSVINETKYIVFTYGSPLEAPLMETVETFLKKTIEYWRNWVKTTGIGNFHQQAVIRSSLALKLHQYEDTGAIIASSTTSLPEAEGEGRNWDYRFCWMRDAYYTLEAFNGIGHFEEMEKYFNYIANIAANRSVRFQPLYSITGKSDLTEKIVDLPGYLANQPVRIGNQASEHIQNDVYGQVLISLLPLYADRRFTYEERKDSESWVSLLLGKIEMVMDEPDAGLWEFRTISQYHCYTYLFHWAGCNAAHKIAKIIGNETLANKAMALSDKASDYIEKCYDPTKKAYTQAAGVPYMDASTLQLIMMHYLDPHSERAKEHLKAVENELLASNALFYRYNRLDDFGKPETTFLITAFWYVEALACVGRVGEAIENFEQLLSYSNHVGLLSEDVLAKDGSQWGNYPQAYSHVGLVNAAIRISQKLSLPNFLTEDQLRK